MKLVVWSEDGRILGEHGLTETRWRMCDGFTFTNANSVRLQLQSSGQIRDVAQVVDMEGNIMDCNLSVSTRKGIVGQVLCFVPGTMVFEPKYRVARSAV